MKINFKQSVYAFITLFTFVTTGSLFAKNKTVGEKVDKGIEKTEKGAKSAKDKTKEFANDAKDKAKDVADKTKEWANDTKEKVKKKAQEEVDKM
jgi:F0F1-type ATP synthase membrane subunit b/b'